METDTIYNNIRKTVLAHLPGSRVLLFGSRARGDNDYNSDYDLLVITPNVYPQKERINWSTKLNHAIVNDCHIPIDLLFYSEEEVLQKKELPGHIIKTALREGVAL